MQICVDQHLEYLGPEPMTDVVRASPKGSTSASGDQHCQKHVSMSHEHLHKIEVLKIFVSVIVEQKTTWPLGIACETVESWAGFHKCWRKGTNLTSIRSCC